MWYDNAYDKKRYTNKCQNQRRYEHNPQAWNKKQTHQHQHHDDGIGVYLLGLNVQAYILWQRPLSSLVIDRNDLTSRAAF